MIDIVKSKFFENIILILLALKLYFSAMLYSESAIIYYLLSLVGIALAVKLRFNFLQPTDLSLNFYIISYIFLGYLFVSILFVNWQLLFGWRFAAYQVLLFVPFIGLLIFRINFSYQKFWKFLIITTSFSFIWLALIVYEGDFVRDQGFLSDPINRGNMGMLFGLVALVAIFAVHGYGWKLLAFVFFLSGVVLSLVSGSRGGWAALLLSVCTIVFVLYRYRDLKSIILIAFSMLFIFLFVVLFWDHLPVADRVSLALNDIERFLEGDYHSSVGYRLVLWQVSFHAFLEAPFFGWGWGNFNEAHQYMIDHGVVGDSRMFGHPHNQLLFFLVEIGLVGTLLFTVFLLYPAYQAIKHLSQKKKLGESVYISLLIIVVTEALMEFSLTDDPMTQPYFVVVFLFFSLFCLRFLSRQNL